VACAGLLLGTGLTQAAVADVALLRDGEAQLAHFAFASQLGSGIYSVSGRTLQIYRLPIGWDALEAEEGHPGLRLKLPTTIGLYDFEARDVIESGLPEQLDTLSVALGAELDFPVGEWHLLPYVEAGRAWDAGGDADATLYTASFHAERHWLHEERSVRLRSGVVYAGVRLDGSGDTADLVGVTAGVEVRRPVGFRIGEQEAEGGAYVLVEWYPDRAEEAVVRSDGSATLPAQAEIGLTLGTRPGLRILGLPVPRIGLAYRFGEGLQAYRLVLGAPF